MPKENTTAPALKSIDEMTPEEMQAALLRSQLRTQLMLEKQAEGTADKFEADTRTKEQKAEAAQRACDAENKRRDDQKNQCRHKQGGFGLENTYKGKGEPSLLMLAGCVPGHKLIYCYRCEGEWRTPQPSLKKSDPKEYSRQLKEFKKMEELYGESTSKTISGPVFGFERDGAPFIPDRV